MAKTPSLESRTPASKATAKASAKASNGKGGGGLQKPGSPVVTPAPSATLPMERYVPDFSEDDRETLQASLQSSLYDLIHLQLVTKQAHWNVVGPTFHPTHLFLDEIWEFVQESTDKTAERLVALGMSPSGQGPDVTANTRVEPIALGFHKDLETLDLMAQRLQRTSADMRDALEPIEDLDPVTADLLHGVIEGLEKYLWMTRAHLF